MEERLLIAVFIVIALIITLFWIVTSTPTKKDNGQNGIISMRQFKLTTVDFTGCRELYFGVNNLVDKTIKYVHFTVDFFNRVNDPVATGKQYFLTGPISTYMDNQMVTLYDIVDSAKSITSAKIAQIVVDYMDGTSVTLAGTDLDAISGPKQTYEYDKTTTEKKYNSGPGALCVILNLILWGIILFA